MPHQLPTLSPCLSTTPSPCTITTLQQAGKNLPRRGIESRGAATGVGIDTHGFRRAPLSTVCVGRGCGDEDHSQKVQEMEGAGCQLRVRNRAGEGREGMVAIGRAQKTLDVQGGRNSFFYTQKTICEPYLWNKLSSLPLVGEKTRTPACAPQLMSPVAGCRLTFQFLYRPQCQQQQHQDPWGRKTDEKERRVEFQFQPMSTWSLPPGGVVVLPAAHGFPAGSGRPLYWVQNQDSACPLHLPGLPEKSVKDIHSFHGTPEATGEGTEPTLIADVRHTT